MKKSTLLILVLAVVSITIGCHSGPPSDPNQGFLVIGQARVYSATNPYSYLDYPTGGRYQGQFVSGAGTYGTITNFNVVSSFATYSVRGAKVPGNWNLALGSDLLAGSLCRGTGTANVNVSLGSQEPVICPMLLLSTLTR